MSGLTAIDDIFGGDTIQTKWGNKVIKSVEWETKDAGSCYVAYFTDGTQLPFPPQFHVYKVA